jgi:putative membrane protein
MELPSVNTLMSEGEAGGGRRRGHSLKAEKGAKMIQLMVWAALIFSGIGVGLWPTRTTLAQGPQLGDAGRAFIKMAASNGQAEIQLGKLAAERADRSEVRDFAKRLEKDHTEANLELLKILDAQRIDVPRDMTPYQETADRLSKLRGVEFDRAFLRQMAKDHEEAVAQFAAEAKEGHNPELKAYAAKLLPTLQDHLRLARDLAGKYQ